MSDDIEDQCERCGRLLDNSDYDLPPDELADCDRCGQMICHACQADLPLDLLKDGQVMCQDCFDEWLGPEESEPNW